MKKFFSILIVAMLATSYVNAATTRIYCKMEYGWWTKDGAAIGIILDSGSATRMTLVSGSGNTWYADVDLAEHTTVTFRRVDGGTGEVYDWGAETTAQNIASNNVGTTNDFFTITNASDTWRGAGNTCNGTWSKYVFTPPVVVLKGGFNGWGDSDVFSDDNGVTASFTRTITAGSYGFKITVDGDWRSYYTTVNRANSGTEYDFSANSTDATLVADISGEYTFTFIYATNKLSVTFPTETVEVDPTFAMHGNFFGGWADTEEFELAGNKATASLTLNITSAGVKEFGMKINNSWTANGVAFTRENNSAVVEAGSGNLTFDADVAGEYTFVWTIATNTLSITYPAAPELETYHIYVDDRTGWELFQLYAWGDREAFGGWPGATTNTTQVVDGVTYKVFTYQAEEDADITLNLIFNNKVGDEGKQLADYTITKAADYYLVATASGVAANNQVNLMGSFNNWTNVDAMTIAPNGLTASCTRLLTKGTHGFKITLGATWKAAAETTAITRDNSATGVTFSEDEGDKTSIVADMTGNYTFTYTYATKKLTVTYPNDPVVYTPALTLKGAFDSWGDGAAFADNGTTASLTRHFEAGQHEFKVIVGDYWKSNAVPFTRGNNVRLFYEDTDNAVLVADLAGDYTFTYDYEEQTIAVSYPAATTTTLYFVNSDSWSPVQAYVYWHDGDNDLSDSPHVWPGNAMTLTGEDAYGFDVYSYTFAGVYTSVIFNNKVGDEGEQIDDQVWNAATPYFYNGTWYASLDAVKAAMVLSLSETADNNGAIAAADGQTLPIEIQRSFAANVLYTLCLPFDVSASDLAGTLKCDTLFVLSDAENNGSELLIYFDKANTIEAGKPYLYVPAENVINPTFVATIDASASQTLTAGDVTMTGFYAPMAMPDGNNFVLGNDRLLHKTTSSAVITNAFRAYFTISGSVPAHIPARVVWRDQQTDTATSLDNATSGSQTIKVIHNGQLLIIRDGKTYNVVGTVVR